jgi:hypothetical protein
MMTLAVVVASAALWPAEAEAQRRRVVVRRAPRTSVFVGVGVGSPYFYRPYYRPFFYDPWLPYYGVPYGWYPPYGAYGYYGPYGYSRDASLRVQVEPKDTEVFVDGYWAGTVDDFDGFFQRLHLEPGEHEVTLYREGHRTIRQKIYLQPNGTFRIRHEMVPLAAGETPDPRPSAPAAPPSGSYDAFGRQGRNSPPSPGERARGPERSRDREPRGPFGAVAVRVQPRDADVLIDGEPWDAPDTSDRLVVELPEGEHRIEVRKEGFTAYTSTVRVRAGETVTVNVSLARE